MTFNDALNSAFPGAMSQSDFIRQTRDITAPLGFTADNTLACVGVCRDELCQPMNHGMTATWGEAFNLSGLAGMLFAGRTGLGAAHAHAPIENGRARYIYVCMAHIGLGPEGQPGQCERPTLPGHVSGACGALMALHGQLTSGHVKTEIDTDDLEQSQLTKRLVQELGPGISPSLIALTKLTLACIGADLEKAIAATVDTTTADYCVFTGIQIHTPDQASGNFTDNSYIFPDKSYAVVAGEQRNLSLSAN